MIDFDSMTSTIFHMNDIFRMTEEDRYLSYLPLSHGMERWLCECLGFVTGMHIFFADSLATFSQDLTRCKPTLFVSVPRLWTKFQQGVYKACRIVSFNKHVISLYSLTTLTGVFRSIPPKKLDKLLKIPIMNRFYKKRVLEMLGFDCVRTAVSGSAPLPGELLAWYKKLGLTLLEGYGMTENFNCE